jgi:hypothetical protein
MSPSAVQQSLMDAMEPKRLHRYWKAEYLAGISSGFLDAFRNSALDARSPLSQSLIFHLGGALNERETDDGAVGNRDATFVAGFNGTWPPGANPEPHVAWVRRAWENIRPFSTGGTTSTSSWPTTTWREPSLPMGTTTNVSKT